MPRLCYYEDMKPLYSYLDYRKYLSDFYAEKKRTKRYFSYRYFSARAGIKSPVLLKLVIDGKRNLTPLMIDRFCKAIELSPKQSRFFRHLVLFNQSKSADEKQAHYHTIKSMQNLVQERLLGNDQYDYLNKWYTPAIREIVSLFNFKDDFALIAKCIEPPITASQAKKSVELLLRLKMLSKKKDGLYIQTDSAITTGSEVAALAARSFNRSMLENAIKALDTFDPSQRYITCQTLGVSKAVYDVIVQEIQSFQERVATIVNQDKESSKVCQLNIQLFPLSKELPALEQEKRK